MSVVCLEEKDKSVTVLFGTGGETIGGHLFRTSLKDIMNGNISSAKVLLSSEKKGFVGSPVCADITADGIYDIIVNAVDGKMIAVDGAADTLLWEVNLPGTEAYTTPAVGYFTGDSIPDFFANFAIGTFPNLPKSIRFMVDGRTGKIKYKDTIPAFQYASPVVADLNGDGYDEAIVNQSALKRKQFQNEYFSYLQVFDFKNDKRYSIGDSLKATNLASTPWIGDLDNDNKLDIIYTAVRYQDVLFDLQKPLGLYVSHFSTPIFFRSKPKWGAYMGSNYNSVFKLW
jgi:hypothetical protein